ncbi:REJ domain protein (macronuclear) [Tetrahymena thermophila SB210]|uniref:REJ domain protein n=1 Tax=Tetrahymena thermophila (strain SB210) TaxID=312017 RepID=I7MJB6_TETTS|nr:REJ domain protein [Tetrahymena thermophila SB210]EAR96156.2 REJ domain protein [Tetrahymena thermophila SB210]|eukprot:XP_001016401.2 REJ domain protein [Tetrahymena thermophila SB210]
MRSDRFRFFLLVFLKILSLTYQSTFGDCTQTSKEGGLNILYSECLLNQGYYSQSDDLSVNLQYLNTSECTQFTQKQCSDTNYLSGPTCDSQTKFQINYSPQDKNKLIKFVYVFIRVLLFTDKDVINSSNQLPLIANGVKIKNGYSTPYFKCCSDSYCYQFIKTFELNSYDLAITFQSLGQQNYKTYLYGLFLGVQYCPQYCSDCDGNSKCSKCFQKYYLSQNSCIACHESCLQCSGPTQNDCVVCLDSTFYISIKQNNICVSDCNLDNGQYVNTSNSLYKYCRLCSNFCQNCNNSTNCTKYFQKYYLNGNICSPCHQSCLQCSGSTQNNCIVCLDSSQYISTSQNNICVSDCNIDNGQYVDTSNSLQKYCKPCSNFCQNCNNSTNCTKCFQKYYLNGNICSPCHQSCLQCSGQTQNNCIICLNSSQYISTSQNNICVSNCDLDNGQFVDTSNSLQKYCRLCPNFCQNCNNSTNCTKCFQKYYLNGNICSPCHQSCLQCSGPTQNNCIICLDSSQYISTSQNNICVSECNIANGYYIDTSNEQQKYCKKCQIQCRTCRDDSSCDSCIDGYYLNSNNKCSPCDSTCQSCSGPLNTNCQVCKTGLLKQLSTNLCVDHCKINEFINTNNECQECDKKCGSCDGPGSNNCLSCYNNTFFYNKMCVSLCPNGYQSNFTTLVCDSCSNYLNLNKCNPCFASCELCDLSQVQNGQCNSCYTETRKFDTTNKKCLCQNPNDQRDLFYQCSYRNVAVLDSWLSGTTPLLTIDFGSPLKDTPNNIYSPQSLCQYIFDQPTMDIIGQDSSCQINGKLIQINLADSSTIMENDSIILLPNRLQFQDYSSDFINVFYRNLVYQSPSGIPQLQFNYNYIENSCNSVNITLSNIQNEAGRKFASLNWSILQFIGSNEQQQNLIRVLQNASQNKNTALTIDPKYIPPNQNITLQFNYLLKVNKIGQQQFTIFYKKQKIIRISYQQSTYPPIYRYMSLSFYFQFYVESCELGQTVYFQEPFDLQLVSNQFQQISLSQYNQSNFKYDILPYTLISNKTLNISLTVSLSQENKIISAKNVSVDILITNLYLQIEGGSSFIVGFQNKLVLNTVFRDYEIEDPNSPQSIDFTWTCVGLTSNDRVCYDYADKQVQLQQGVSYISFPAKTFTPYSIIVLQITGQKGSRQTNSTATCIFTELDIPSLLVKFNSTHLTQKINLNEELNFVIVYGGNFSSDILSYAGALLYENNLVGAIKFDYYQVKFRVWNFFQNVKPSKPTIQIRFSVYNPSFFMPSLSTLSFIVNIPPQGCTLRVDPQQGVALQTVFSIQYQNCDDEDLPLTYQFFYYNNIEDIQQELIAPWNIVRRQIQDQTINNQIQTVLPQGNLVIMGQAMDSQLGISNSTITIVVLAQNKSPDEYYQTVNNLVNKTLQIQSSSQYTDQLVALSLIGEDISKNSQQQLSQQMANLLTLIITNMQQISLKLPEFSLLFTFANKVIAQLSQLLFNSQQNYSSQKKDIFKQLQTTMQNTFISIQNNNQSPLQQNNDLHMQNVIDSFKILNSSITQNSSNSFDDFQNYSNVSNYIGFLLTNMTLPNQGHIIISGNLSSLLSDKITQKNIFQYALPFDESNTENSTNIFSITRNNYKVNIYENTTGFEAYTQQYKNVSQNFTYSKNQLISTQIYSSSRQGLQNGSNTQIPMNDSLTIYQFDNAIKSEKYSMTCLQQNDVKWNKNDCSIFNKNNNKFMCFCKTQQPTTIIEDLEDIFTKNKNLQTVFGEQGFKNIENFNYFYQYLAFWVLFTFTLIQIALFIIGIYLDKSSFKKMNQQVHSERQDYNQQNLEQQQYNQQLDLQEIPEVGDQNEIQISPIALNSNNNNQINNNDKINNNSNENIQKLQTQSEQFIPLSDNQVTDIPLTLIRKKTTKFVNKTIYQTQSSLNQFNENNLNNRSNQLFIKRQYTININCSEQNEEILNTQVSPQSQTLELQNQNEKSKQQSVYQKISNFKKLAIFHQLFSIFYLYDKQISRPTRFTLLYIKLIHTLAISILFAGYTMLIQQIFIALLNSLILKVSSFIIVQTFKKGSFWKFISVIFQLLISLLYFYIILAISSGKTPSESNDFIILFLVSFIIEMVFTELILSLVINILVKKYFLCNDENSIYSKLFKSLKIKEMISSIDT